MWKDDTTNSISYYLFQSMLWLAIASALILFMPTAFLNTFKLNAVMEQSAHLIGISFILSSTYLVIDFVSSFVRNAKLKARQATQLERIQDRVKTLTSGERAVLREFYLQRQTSLWLPAQESDVKSLLSSGVLIAVDFYATTRHNEEGIKEIELMISHDARQYLTKTRLKLPQGKPNGQDITYLKLARPSYLAPITELKRSA